MRRVPSLRTALMVALLGFGFSCDNDNEQIPACLGQLESVTCAPLYPSEFGVLYRQVFAPTCGAQGLSCHSTEGQQGRLEFADEATSYAALLGLGGRRPLVVPGNPRCSELMVRLELGGRVWSMPPGTPLDEGARCSIRRWIADGSPPTREATP